ncbi:dehydrogenase [Pseudoclavibacter endophyticus]|uniref:NAD(P)/FAD-dependent oxidoreductase n=1 Tax=Pseudoclavibacter endophyticus TaxID=1778590 RepID=UPI0016670A67|nr:dehydrogenase [Pseudoclavibacter endophyticus]
MTKILIVGGGYAGFYIAWQLEKKLRPGEAQVTLADPLPYMTYQPFLPEVVGGHIEARHAVVSHRRHLKRTRVLTASVTQIDHANKVATIVRGDDDSFEFDYDIVVVTAGSVSRTFPTPGIADNAIGMKAIEEAVWVRDKIIDNFNLASTLPPGDARDRLLTFVVVGGGFAGIETFAEMRSLATALLEDYPSLQFDDVHFHLIEAAGRIMPEVTEEGAENVIRALAERGANIHLNTMVESAVDGVVKTSTGDEYPTDVIVWTAGVQAAPLVKSFSDLPVDERGRLRARADLRVEGDDGVVRDAWAAGDVAAVPDLSGGGVGGFCVPNAQHAVRQAKHLAGNLVSTLRGEAPRDYYHENLGAVAGLGPWLGSFRMNDIQLDGALPWLAHRGYHGLAMPTFERKVRVVSDWLNEFLLGRDFVSIPEIGNPRGFFERFAARPKPQADDQGTGSGASDAPGEQKTEQKSEQKTEQNTEPAKPAAAKPAGAKPASSRSTASRRTTAKPGASTAPKADAAKADAAKADAPKADAPKADAAKADAPKADAPKADAAKTDAVAGTNDSAASSSAANS